MKKKMVRIRCEGAGYVKLDKLKPFQGELKTLAEVDYERLKKEILDLGMSEPVSVWLQDGVYHILNGHQRCKTLTRMREDGYEVPDIPVNYIEAKNANEAKRKILALTSQYGKIEQKGLYDFLENSDIKVDELMDSFRFPEVDLEEFANDFYPEEPAEQDYGDKNKELSEDEFSDFDHQCPKCGFEFSGKKK